jgi:hypothetical protein
MSTYIIVKDRQVIREADCGFATNAIKVLRPTKDEVLFLKVGNQLEDVPKVRQYPLVFKPKSKTV